jgi:hypothetical protein
MAITNPKYRLTRVMVDGAPEEAGVYALWESDELIYVGRASGTTTIRARLLEHLESQAPCTMRASHYSWELSLRPALRENEVLGDYQARHGRAPKCNAA